jgi:hypothetical protein
LASLILRFKSVLLLPKAASILKTGWALLAHTCNPSYPGGRDQEDHGSKPAQANSSQEPISKKTLSQKIGLVEWLKV